MENRRERAAWRRSAVIVLGAGTFGEPSVTSQSGSLHQPGRMLLPQRQNPGHHLGQCLPG